MNALIAMLISLAGCSQAMAMHPQENAQITLNPPEATPVDPQALGGPWRAEGGDEACLMVFTFNPGAHGMLIEPIGACATNDGLSKARQWRTRGVRIELLREGGEVMAAYVMDGYDRMRPLAGGFSPLARAPLQ